MNNLEDFSNFNEIDYTPLRVYNRTVMAINLKNDIGTSGLKEYLEQFSEDERKQIGIMIIFITTNGLEKARETIMNNMPLEEEQEEKPIVH